MTKNIPVGPFKVVDCSADALVKTVSSQPGKRVAFALHVGGLNDKSSHQYVDAMNAADWTYADGAAVVLLARVAGAQTIERSATTDIGIPLIRAESERLGRPARVAIVGGRQERADRAAATLSSDPAIEIVFVHHGYFTDEVAIFHGLRDAQPDIVVVGLGMPREALWVTDNRSNFPDALIFTCGGWLGFLAGDESRAPLRMQQIGLEWLYRLSLSPRRLFARYTNGMITTASLIPTQLAHRRKRRSERQ